MGRRGALERAARSTDAARMPAAPPPTSRTPERSSSATTACCRCAGPGAGRPGCLREVRGAEVGTAGSSERGRLREVREETVRALPTGRAAVRAAAAPPVGRPRAPPRRGRRAEPRRRARRLVRHARARAARPVAAGRAGAPAAGARRQRTRLHFATRADVAQLVEHFTRNEGVPGSNPGVGSSRKARSGGPSSWPGTRASPGAALSRVRHGHDVDDAAAPLVHHDGRSSSSGLLAGVPERGPTGHVAESRSRRPRRCGRDRAGGRAPGRSPGPTWLRLGRLRAAPCRFDAEVATVRRAVSTYAVARIPNPGDDSAPPTHDAPA
jgi:hypothetical protein